MGVVGDCMRQTIAVVIFLFALDTVKNVLRLVKHVYFVVVEHTIKIL